MLKHYMIEFEAIDKAGKEIISQYVKLLGKYKYVLMDRGILSNISYAKLNDRQYEYDLSAFKDWVVVYLVVDKEDWEIRCKLSNEPNIDYAKHMAVFSQTAMQFNNAGIPVLVYNTSKYTPYQIAKDIIHYMEELEKKDNGQLESSQTNISAENCNSNTETSNTVKD